MATIIIATASVFGACGSSPEPEATRPYVIETEELPEGGTRILMQRPKSEITAYRAQCEADDISVCVDTCCVERYSDFVACEVEHSIFNFNCYCGADMCLSMIAQADTAPTCSKTL